MQTKNLNSAAPRQATGPAAPTRVPTVPPLLITEQPELDDELIERLAAVEYGLAAAHSQTAAAFLQEDLYSEARRHLEAAVNFAPDHFDYLNQLGTTCYLQGDDVAAVAAFERALSLNPANIDAAFNLGMVLYGREQFDDAERCFRRVTDAGSADAETWNNRGACLFQLGEASEAEACFERALAIDPRHKDARANLAALMRPSGAGE